MKKIAIFLLALVSLAAAPQSASAQFDISKVLGGLFGGSSKSTTTELATASTPYTKLADAAPAITSLYGTWSYSSASFASLGSNPLADVVLAQLDPIVLDVLKNMGVSEGSARLKIESGKGLIWQGSSSQNFKYTYERSKARIVLSTVINSKSVSVSGYIKYASPKVSVMLDVKELIKAIKTIYPEYQNDQNLVLVETLVRDMNDVYAVGVFTKL